MRIEVMFIREPMRKMKFCEVAQVPHTGDCIALSEEDGVYDVETVIFYVNPTDGNSVAQVRVK